jgi:hypothetical protein
MLLDFVQKNTFLPSAIHYCQNPSELILNHTKITKRISVHYNLASLINVLIYKSSEPGSSVSIVSGYGLDDRAIEVRPPAEARQFFL